MSVRPYKNLDRLNKLAAEKAEAAFFYCCASREWAKAMTASRPFGMLEDLFTKAASLWFAMSVADWLEAFARNSRAADTLAQLGAGLAGEQRLAELGREYERKFGFPLVLCGDGRDVDELLAVGRARQQNSVQTELEIAAEEQRKIIENRLTWLLETEGSFTDTASRILYPS